MKTLRTFFIMAVVSLVSLSFSGCTTPYSTTVVSARYVNPPWAPSYETGIRYYYFPDIEVYYDLSNQEFIYLYSGRWYFSRTLPSIYAGFDLYNGFIISLNMGVYQPWRHHQYYISHYPRYYYRNYYRNYDPQRMRGFNENKKAPLYRGNNKPDNYNPEPYQNGRRSDQRERYQQNKQSTQQRQEGYNRNNQEQNRPDRNKIRSTEPQQKERKIESTREPQRPNYYGKKIGKPVKVERQMREQKTRTTNQQSKSSGKSTNSQQRGRR